MRRSNLGGSTQITKIQNDIENAFKDIGYSHNLLQKDYEYTDFLSSYAQTRRVHLGIFAQEPLDYRSACFGVYDAGTTDKSEGLVRNLRALGAPQVFILINGKTERWAITDKAPILQDTYRTQDVPNIIVQNHSAWNPLSMLRAKSGIQRPGPVQLDFVDVGLLPALEHEAETKIDRLLRVILATITQEIDEVGVNTFRLVFSLLAAKLLKDRDLAPGIDFSIPGSPIEAVQKHYNISLRDVVNNIPDSLLRDISAEIGSSFSLRNISVDTLTYVYENTLVSDETRQELGIHSTPSYLADYVLGQLPIEEIPQERWHTLNLCAAMAYFSLPPCDACAICSLKTGTAISGTPILRTTFME